MKQQFQNWNSKVINVSPFPLQDIALLYEGDLDDVAEIVLNGRIFLLG